MMLRNWRLAGWCIFSCCLAASGQDAKDFATHIRPVLQANCTACHNPANAKSRNNFLKGEDASDVESRRGLWRNVATQLRNRTMPPGGVSKLSEADRLQVANWIDARLRSTGCNAGDYAGFVPARRLNRREYKNTARDLFGVDLSAADLFPADEAGGAGFDTNGETLYLPPMMLERYMEAAQVLLDRVIITPALSKVTLSHELEPRVPAPTGIRPTRVLQPGEKVSMSVSVFAEGSYGLRVSVERPKLTPFDVQLEVDGVLAGKMSFPRDSGGGATARTINATWTRGAHNITLINGSEKIDFYSLTVEQRLNPAPAEKRALHYRLFGQEAGEAPVNPRLAARRLLARFLPKAYRAPVDAATVDRFLALYDRSAARAEPFEEGIKLALKGVLVSPRFLFRVEQSNGKPGIQPLGQYEMASRLSYFLWATMPDEELLSLAARGQLQDPKVLTAQVERMLDDPRSRAFANAFMGQWLGTQDVGGRVVPLLTELQHFYTPEVAADLREQPELMFHYMLQENRSVLDLLTGKFTFLTERLARFYEVEGQVKGVQGSGFHLTEWPDNKRAGVLGLASVLAMSSHYRQGSPVLRGAWVLDTLLGTPVPPPPPDVPVLETPKKLETAPTMRQMLAKHRAQESCAACHNLMDPIGLGLENFDWMGRWRDKELNGQPVDASGVLPSGEKFNGPVELRQVLLNRKEEFLRQFTGKVMGYALGRGLQDGDQCTVQRLMDGLAKDGYKLRTLVRDLVLSTPFRNAQADAVVSEAGPAPKKAPKRLLGEK
jgi:cytochrome c553